MNTPDLEAYILGEGTAEDRRAVEQRIAADPQLAAEAERLRVVVTALHRLPEEEPPRRIAFVSDKVFEPKWYHAFWISAPRLGFAAAGMLAVAILAHGFLTRPVSSVSPSLSETEIQARVTAAMDAEVSKRIEPAVAKAVAAVRAEAEAKSERNVKLALDQAEKRFALERQADRVAVEASFDVLRKQMNRMIYLASNERERGQ